MKLILLSGGKGKRLWPFSTDQLPKQYISFLRSDDGKKESLIQRLWNQLKRNIPVDNDLFIATNIEHSYIIENQLGSDVNLITEPEYRDTFPAVSLICSYLCDINTSLDEVITILPVDLVVDDSFIVDLIRLNTFIKDSNYEIGLMGTTPSFPSESFGYIVPFNKLSKKFYQVDSFKEKPNKALATKLITQNALWNCGVFCFKLQTMVEIMKNKGIPTDYKRIIQTYDSIPKISFDHEILEHRSSTVVLHHEGIWKDFGIWESVIDGFDYFCQNEGEYMKTENFNIYNELSVPIKVVGLTNILVVATNNGILVTDRNSSHRIKEQFE